MIRAFWYTTVLYFMVHIYGLDKIAKQGQMLIKTSLLLFLYAPIALSFQFPIVCVCEWIYVC